MVICVTEPKSGSQKVGTRSNSDLMEGKMFRGEGGNGLTLRKFLVFLFELLISTLFSGGMSLVSFFLIASAPVFFKEDDPHFHNDRVFFGREHCLDRPFEMDRFTVEILGFVVSGIVW